MWGLATAFSTAFAAAFYLRRMIAADPDWNALSPWLDALVTGLVVGSGTNPLHDLISRAQKRNERETTAQAWNPNTTGAPSVAGDRALPAAHAR